MLYCPHARSKPSGLRHHTAAAGAAQGDAMLHLCCAGKAATAAPDCSLDAIYTAVARSPGSASYSYA